MISKRTFILAKKTTISQIPGEDEREDDEREQRLIRLKTICAQQIGVKIAKTAVFEESIVLLDRAAKELN